MALTYEPIATTTLSSAATGITFSSISSAYTDLRIVVVATASTAAACRMQFNSDTGTNYSRTDMSADGSSASSSRASNAAFIPLTPAGALDTTIPCLLTADIFSYAGSTNKTCLVSSSQDINGSGGVGVEVGLWRSTNAISTIYIYAGSGNLSIGTTATLYGIKSA